MVCGSAYGIYFWFFSSIFVILNLLLSFIRNTNTLSHPFAFFLYLQPSSCLSDKEEDEIYGFGYGVFAPRVGRPAMHLPTTTVNVHHPQNHIQSIQPQLSTSQPNQLQHQHQLQQMVHPQQQHLQQQQLQQQLQQLQHVPAGQQRCLFKRNFWFSFTFFPQPNWILVVFVWFSVSIFQIQFYVFWTLHHIIMPLHSSACECILDSFVLPLFLLSNFFVRFFFWHFSFSMRTPSIFRQDMLTCTHTQCTIYLSIQFRSFATPNFEKKNSSAFCGFYLLQNFFRLPLFTNACVICACVCRGRNVEFD